MVFLSETLLVVNVFQRIGRRNCPKFPLAVMWAVFSGYRECMLFLLHLPAHSHLAKTALCFLGFCLLGKVSLTILILHSHLFLMGLYRREELSSQEELGRRRNMTCRLVVKRGDLDSTPRPVFIHFVFPRKKLYDVCIQA